MAHIFISWVVAWWRGNPAENETIPIRLGIVSGRKNEKAIVSESYTRFANAPIITPFQKGYPEPKASYMTFIGVIRV